jgi:CHAD domain-containing protein
VSPTARRPGPFVVRLLRGLDARLTSTIPRVLAETDAAAVHDMRVAIRRLRTLLRMARPVLGRFHVDAARRAFARFQQSSGSLRDEEALGDLLDAAAVTEPTVLAWRERRRLHEKVLRRALVTRLRQGALRRARSMIAALVVLPVDPEGTANSLPRFAERTVARAQKRVAASSDVGIEDAAGLHRLRIAHKQLRYAIELFATALPPGSEATAKVSERFQKRLGDIHDVDVALAAIARARGLSPAGRALLVAALRDARGRATKRYLKDAPQSPPSSEGDLSGRWRGAPEDLDLLENDLGLRTVIAPAGRARNLLNDVVSSHRLAKH